MPMEFKLPELGENIKSGTITKLLVAVGDAVSKEMTVLEMETDKAVVEVPCPLAGKVTAIHVKVGDKIAIGQKVLSLEGTETPVAPAPKIEKPAAAPAKPAPKAEALAAVAPSPTAEPGRLPVAAAPSVRQFAREIGVDIAQVTGSSPDGRISIDDVKSFAKQLLTGRSATATGPAIIPLPDFSKWGTVEREAMSAIRRKTAEHMVYAWTTIPHVTQHDQADITKLDELRKRFSPRVEAAGAKLTVTAILVKIIASALKVFPKFAASVDMAKNEVVYKKYYHVGVAVDTPRGLLVPVLRDVDKKNVIQLAVELKLLAEKARNGKLTLDEMTGGTFSLTNLGGIGGSFFTPIINTPEVAILGIGRSILSPTFGAKDGCCQPRTLLPLSLSYDHRLIDGADGARFLRWIIEAVEEPLLITLEG